MSSFVWWTSAAEARELGATHHARLFGIVPGFLNPETGLWVPRSDALELLEHVLAYIWVNMRLLRGQEPDFAFSVGREIAA